MFYREAKNADADEAAVPQLAACGADQPLLPAIDEC
jgi:hypothetical protein